MSKMKDTLYGLIHILIGDSVITNSSNEKMRSLLWRMVMFVYQALVDQDMDVDDPDKDHVPDLQTLESLTDLLALTFFRLMSNVLDFRTYRLPNTTGHEPLTSDEESLVETYNVNAMNQAERTMCTYVRGMARKINEWIFEHYSIQLAGADMPLNIENWVTEHHAHLAASMVRYKQKANTLDVVGAPGCTLERLASQIDKTIEPDSTLGRRTYFLLESETDIESMARTYPPMIVTQVTKPTKPANPLTSKQLIAVGKCKADEDYQRGVECNFQLPRVSDFNAEESTFHVEKA
ncbi:hypothetical protein M413DRAFT_20985 [Hebeloma cylindrosporum]|uniref:Uncharacterized protein n=1 Tax=Hebeloma cylindrosporum TaxID=76867 RepID=A0A0C3CIX2_HEBCY|nr:hypothetical protein M413DRAFT_20985 [Hebeloma cylindrosporum h7]